MDDIKYKKENLNLPIIQTSTVKNVKKFKFSTINNKLLFSKYTNKAKMLS